jgi:predicted metal-dependent phosphoesterase TrpH
MIRVELHCHTIYSTDCLVNLPDLLRACQRKGIQRLAVTDHNHIQGALKAQGLDPQMVIVGEEIATQSGELLAFFVREEVPPGLPPEETIALLREQGAFISVAHPFDRFRSGHWKLAELERIAPLVDAVEVFNARCLWPGFNRQAQAFARTHTLPGTVGSDAHTLFEVGQACLLLPDFQDVKSLREALTQATPQVSLSPPWVHLASRYAAWHEKLAGV